MRIWLFLAFIFTATVLKGQTSDTAYQLGVDGVKAIEAGKFKDGIKLLKKAWSLEPNQYDYPFEIGRAFYLDNQHKKAEKYLFQLQYHADVQADLYTLLANCYNELNELKKTPDFTRKKELDALRYGIQKLPQAGTLYLELGKRKLEQGETVDALAVFESGIANAPNFTENYFWAAKLMKASRNHLWAWLYAELYLNMADNPEMTRTAARIIAESMQKMLSGNWRVDPEQMDQELAFLLKEKCQPLSSDIEGAIQFRECLMTEWTNTNFALRPLIERSKVLKSRGFLEVYLGSVLLEADKEAFLTWLASNAERFEAFRRWRYYNPMMITKPIVRVQ